MFAAFNGARDVAALLVEASADTSRENAGSSTAAEIAAEQGHEEIAALVAAGPGAAAPDDVTRIARLRQAVRRGDTAVLQAFLAGGADVGSPTNRGRTLLMLAVESRQRETAEALLAAKADLEARDRDGGTVLITALHTDASLDLSWLEWLLGAGSDPGKAGSPTARGDVLKRLLEAGADRAAKSTAGDTAASVARASGHEYLLAQLE